MVIIQVNLTLKNSTFKTFRSMMTFKILFKKYAPSKNGPPILRLQNNNYNIRFRELGRENTSMPVPLITDYRSEFQLPNLFPPIRIL